MTDKTELLSVSRELLERVTLGDASRGATAGQLLDSWVAMGELRALLAAPAAGACPPLIKTLRDNGELIALKATVAQQAKMIEALQAKDVSKGLSDELASLFADGFLNDQMISDIVGVVRKHTPAEDVRAVVDEPVAFELLFNGEQVDVVGKHGFSPASLETYHRNGYESGRLYRHPQRPVVLPERKSGIFENHEYESGWNACLDEVERLNK